MIITIDTTKVLEFVRQEVEPKPDGYVKKALLYQRYKDWAFGKSLDILPDTLFFREFYQCSGLKPSRRRINKVLTYIILGCSLRNNTPEQPRTETGVILEEIPPIEESTGNMMLPVEQTTGGNIMLPPVEETTLPPADTITGGDGFTERAGCQKVNGILKGRCNISPTRFYLPRRRYLCKAHYPNIEQILKQNETPQER